jgi:hypothetical protein
MSSLSDNMAELSVEAADSMKELPSGQRKAPIRSAHQQQLLDALDAQKFGENPQRIRDHSIQLTFPLFLGWPQIRVILIAGVGFFTSAYDIFAINLATTILGPVYFEDSTLPTNTNTGIKVSALVGIFCGQLVFGFLSDR